MSRSVSGFSVGDFRAGIASVPVPAPLGIDLVGFLRRHVPVRGHGQPLEVTALVLDDGEHRATLVGLDLLATPGVQGVRIRQAIAEASGTEMAGVFVNSQHTHAAPPPPGMIKLGGLVHELTPNEVAYWEQLVRSAARAAKLAAEGLRPARVGGARSSVEGLSVNRRERMADRTTILGWNPDAECDRTVSTLRIDGSDGAPIATVVSFACHPVVVGPDVPEASSDYVGALRSAVRTWTGADCLFLQGCAGNVNPLESFMEEPGAEVLFGHRLAMAALCARYDASPGPRRLERTEYGSAVPIARYRWVTEGNADISIDFATKEVEFPLDEHPTLGDIEMLRADLEAKVRDLKADGCGPEMWNPVEIHAAWAALVEQRIRAGTAELAISAPVQVVRIGRIAVVGLPGEPFNEIGTRIKQASPASFTICCGYTNAAPGYLPTTEEHSYGGYEVAVNHRHYGNVAPISVGCDRLLEQAATDLLSQLFPDDDASSSDVATL